MQVLSETTWAQVTAGQEHSFVISTTGELYAFGRNTTGALGDGTVLRRSSPVQIGTGNKWQMVAAGRHTGTSNLNTFGIEKQG